MYLYIYTNAVIYLYIYKMHCVYVDEPKVDSSQNSMYRKPS